MKPKLKCPHCGKRIGQGLPMANHTAAHQAEEALAKRYGWSERNPWRANRAPCQSKAF